MFSRMKSFFSFAALALVFFTAGWACNKYGNTAGVNESQVVATVDGHDITFGEWMKQVDLTRVFITPIDPSNSDQIKAVLTSLIDQQLVLDAAQKANFSDAAFDEALKKKMLEADLTIKEEKDRLEKDRQTVDRLEKNYKDSYKRMLLAHEFAASQFEKVAVTDKDMRDWYANYAARAAQEGQKLPPYEKVKARVEGEVKPNVQREKFVSNLEADGKVTRNEDIIKKYLGTLSASQELLDSKGPAEDTKDDVASKDGGKK